MLVDTLSSLLMYGVLACGLAWPLTARLALPPPDKLLATVVLSLLGVFLLAWSVYVFALPRSALWALPLLSVLGLAESRRALRDAWRDREFREMVIAQAIVMLWCVGWLALVVTYSGGFWVADWFGHWQRTAFFLERGPPDILFNGFDPLTSRPPLANIVVGAFLAVTRNDFAHFQLALTVFGSLSFLPAALLARRIHRRQGLEGEAGGRTVTYVLAVLFMVSPMFVENATYSWTKLPAAFFTLAAIYFFLRAHDEAEPSSAGPLCAATLAAALLTHYSAGPYAIFIAGGWIALGWTRLGRIAWWQKTARAGLVGAALLATWFGWSLATYGGKGTFLTNTSVTDMAPTAGGQFWTALLNIRDTIVPHFLRSLDYADIGQSSVWGWWRDWFFQLYQINLIFVFGSINWLVLAVVLWRNRHRATPAAGIAWGIALTSIFLLGIAVVGGRHTWGLAHICLQPIVVLGLTVLAAQWPSIGGRWRRLMVAGGVVDLVLGIALQFGAQSFLLDQWFAAGRAPGETFLSYSSAAVVNLRAKSYFKFSFFGDGFAAYDTMNLLLLGALLLTALLLASRRNARA